MESTPPILCHSAASDVDAVSSSAGPSSTASRVGDSDSGEGARPRRCRGPLSEPSCTPNDSGNSCGAEWAQAFRERIRRVGCHAGGFRRRPPITEGPYGGILRSHPLQDCGENPGLHSRPLGRMLGMAFLSHRGATCRGARLDMFEHWVPRHILRRNLAGNFLRLSRSSRLVFLSPHDNSAVSAIAGGSSRETDARMGELVAICGAVAFS